MWTDIFFKAPVLRSPGKMAAIFHLPSITAGERWHDGLRAEAGAEPAAGGFPPLISWWSSITVIHMSSTVCALLYFTVAPYVHLGISKQTGCKR